MDKKSKILFVAFFLLILGSIVVTAWKILIKRDYIVEFPANCDPAIERCFIKECDPEVEECTGDPVMDTTYFKKVFKNADNIPSCDSNSEDCRSIGCATGEADCTVVMCDESAGDGEDICSDPEQYSGS